MSQVYALILSSPHHRESDQFGAAVHEGWSLFRRTDRKAASNRHNDAHACGDIIALARQYGRYGYRRVTALLRNAGWHVNRKRVERIWRREGLKVPQRQPKRGRLWLNDGSCIRLRPEYPGHVWSYDFVEGRTHDGRKYRILSIIDEASRECMALPVARKLKSDDVLAALAELFVTRGPPAHIRSDNGPEFIATAVQEWLAKVGVKTLYIAPGSPWEKVFDQALHLIIPAQFASLDAGHLLIDVFAAVTTVSLALVAHRFWPMIAAVFQVLPLLAHFSRVADLSMQPIAYLTMQVAASWLLPPLLVLATWRHQRRLQRSGSDRSWQISSLPFNLPKAIR
jgi:hypothetical protein